MKLNSMKPAKISRSLRRRPRRSRERREEQARGAADEAQHCSAILPTMSASMTAKTMPTINRRGDQRRAFRRHNVLRDHVGDAAGMVGSRAERRGEDGRREDADAVGSEVLQEPGHRRQDGGAPIFLLNRAAKLVTARRLVLASGAASLISDGYCGLRTRSFFASCSASSISPRAGQPVGALDNVEAAERHQHRRNDRAGVHPAPGAEFGQNREDEKADRGAGERADRLKGERAEHQLATASSSGCFPR